MKEVEEKLNEIEKEFLKAAEDKIFSKNYRTRS